MYSNAKYINDQNNEPVFIKVEIDGKDAFVPLDGNNTDYGTIQDLIASGDLVVAPADVL
ncbi:hypothetical protein UFOVP55_77 [uncultured Caudovirales phage]|uniref:Uncharacterized protein n=1 Tax=uncultured Caudovirales phage TaxID=2100421 RepID=A0A6J5KV43_9CAUD|nr:hypothetical protein UFOVP55_77 [uncultured Caudovirales phage]